MTKYEKVIMERIKRGGLKLAYKPFYDLDIDKVCPTLLTKGPEQVGKKGSVVIFEK